MKKGGYVLWSFLTGQFFAFYMYSNILETRVSFIGFKKHNSQKIKIENVTLSYFLFIDAIWTKIIRQILVLKIPLYVIQKGRGDMLALWCLWDIFDLLYFCSTLRKFSTKSLPLLGMPRVKDHHALELNSAFPLCPNVHITWYGRTLTFKCIIQCPFNWQVIGSDRSWGYPTRCSVGLWAPTLLKGFGLK